MNNLADTCARSSLFSKAALMLKLETEVNAHLATTRTAFFIKLVVLFDEREIVLYTTNATERLQLLRMLPILHRMIGNRCSEIAEFTLGCKVHPLV